MISDIVKPHSKEAVKALKKAGIRKTVMLTGDSGKVAEHVAGELGLDEVYSQLLPADKVEKVEELLKNKREKEKTGFRGGWHQRRTCTWKSRYRYCHGRHGLRRSH